MNSNNQRWETFLGLMMASSWSTPTFPWVPNPESNMIQLTQPMSGSHLEQNISQRHYFWRAAGPLKMWFTMVTTTTTTTTLKQTLQGIREQNWVILSFFASLHILGIPAAGYLKWRRCQHWRWHWVLHYLVFWMNYLYSNWTNGMYLHIIYRFFSQPNFIHVICHETSTSLNWCIPVGDQWYAPPI